MVVATVLTACGIETTVVLIKVRPIIQLQQCLPLAVLKPYYIFISSKIQSRLLQQCLPLAVCDEGCEAAEEQSDDEARTSLVPD